MLGVVVLAFGWAAVAHAARGEPKRALTKVDQARATSVLLRRSDLGTGFVGHAPSDDALPENVRCDALDESDLTITGDAHSKDFRLQTSGAFITVGSSAQVYSTLAQANASWKRGAGPATATCLADIVMRSAGASGRVKVLSSKQLPFVKVAAKTIAFRVVASLTAGSRTVTVYFDAIVVQNGRIQAGVVTTSVGRVLPRADEVALAAVLAGRVAKTAGTKLPGPIA